jgi:hypothetical protein
MIPTNEAAAVVPASDIHNREIKNPRHPVHLSMTIPSFGRISFGMEVKATGLRGPSAETWPA